MLQEKEMTTLNPSVAADGEQSLTNHNNSITDDAPCVNEDSVNLENDEQYDFEAEQREMWKRMDPNYLKTVSMPELYDTVYPSRREAARTATMTFTTSQRITTRVRKPPKVR